MIFIPKHFCLCPVPQILVAGSSELCCLLEGEITRLYDDSSQCPSLRSSETRASFLPFKLCCKETSSWIHTLQTYYPTLNYSILKKRQESHVSWENSPLSSTLLLDDTPETLRKERNPSHTNSLEWFINMEWFQKICCETISGVVFLVDLRNLHLNIASNVMLTTQKNTMRATAVESINTFLEALKTFYLNRQLNSSELPLVIPDVLVIFIFEKFEAVSSFPASTEALVKQFCQDVLLECQSTQSKIQIPNATNMLSSHLLTTSTDGIPLFDTTFEQQFTLHFNICMDFTTESVQPIYYQIKNMASVFCKTVLDDFKKTFKAIASKEDFIYSEIQFQLKMAFFLEFTQQCDEVLSLYTHLWNQLLDALSQHPPYEQWIKILYFVHIRSLIWMCQCNTTNQISIFLKRLQGVLLQKNNNCKMTKHIFLQLWNIHSSLIVSCFSNEKWIIKESSDVLLTSLHNLLSDDVSELTFPFQNVSVCVPSSKVVYKKTVSVSFFIRVLLLFEDLFTLLTFSSNSAPLKNLMSTYPWLVQEWITCQNIPANASENIQLFKDWLFFKVSDYINIFLPYLFYSLPLIPRSCTVLIFYISRFFFTCRSYANSLLLINILSRLTLGTMTRMSAFISGSDVFIKQEEEILVDTSQHQVLRFLPLTGQPNIKAFHYETVAFLGYSSLVLWIHVFSILVACRMLEESIPLELSQTLPPEIHMSETDQKNIEAKILQSTHYISYCVHAWLNEQYTGVFYTDSLLDVSFLLKHSIITSALTLYDSFTGIKKNSSNSLSCLDRHLFESLTTVLERSFIKKSDSFFSSLPSIMVAPMKQQLRFFLKSFAVFISANVTPQNAHCSLVTYHWLSVNLLVDVIRIITLSDDIYEFPIMALVDCSKSQSENNDSQQFTSALLLQAKHSYFFRITLPNEEKKNVIWFQQIKTIEFHCVGFNQRAINPFWIQPRVCVPVLQIETLPTSLLTFSQPFHQDLWASWLLYIAHFHSTLSHFHSTLLDSNLLSKIQNPFQSLHSNFIDILFASVTFHDTAPATSLFYASIQPKSFCASILSTTCGLYDSHCRNEDLDVVNTTTHPSIIRPLSVQLTEQGHIQLNYPDTNVKSLLENVILHCSSRLFTGSPSLLFCQIGYTDIVQHMTCRIHFISHFQVHSINNTLSPNEKITPHSSHKDITTFAVYQKKQEESRNTQQTSSPYTFCVSPVNDQGTVFRLPLQKTEESNHHHFNFSKYSHVHYASSSSYYEPCIIFLESPETSTNDLKGHFVANVPFFLLAHHPGNFFLNVSMTVEFNNKVIDLVTRSIMLTSQRPFHLSLQKLITSNIEHSQSETLHPGTSQFSASSHSIVPFSFNATRIFQNSPAQYLSISVKNICKDALRLNTVQLVVDSKNTNSIYIDVNKTTFGLDSLSTSAECPSTREYSVIQQGAQWLGVLCIDDLLQIMETVCQIPDSESTHSDILQTFYIHIEYSFADPSSVFSTHYGNYVKNYPINSFVYKKNIGCEVLSLLREILPCYIFTTHVQFIPLGTPFQLYATIVNVTCQCMSFTLELQNVTTENNKINQKRWSSDVFFVGGLVKTSLFLSPQSSRKISWTLIGLKEGRFKVPRISLTQILSDHPNFDQVSKHLSLTNILELELTSSQEIFKTTNATFNPLILNSPISQITITAPLR